MNRNRAQYGFTLLEVLVATAIMGIAVAGLLADLSTSVRSAARVIDYDRASLLAQHKMNELLLTPKLPEWAPFEGGWEPGVADGIESGWTARVTPFEAAPGAGFDAPVLERIELQIWWMDGTRRRTFTLEGFRRGRLGPSGMTPPGGSAP